MAYELANLHATKATAENEPVVRQVIPFTIQSERFDIPTAVVRECKSELYDYKRIKKAKRHR